MISMIDEMERVRKEERRMRNKEGRGECQGGGGRKKKSKSKRRRRGGGGGGDGGDIGRGRRRDAR